MLGVQINYPMLDFRDHLIKVTTNVRQLAKIQTKRLLSPNRKNKATRNAIGLISSFPTDGIHRPTKEIGLWYAPMKDRATQMGIEHITDILNKPTDRGYISHAHTTRVTNPCQHWPKKVHEANQARLPTLRVLFYIHNIPGAELEHNQNI